MKLTEGIAREAVVVVVGAIVAAWLIGQVPSVRDWIARQWAPARGGCTCD